jgi:hypothetical protein
MTVNIGFTDRTIRIVLGIALLALLLFIDSPMRWIGLTGVVLLVTASTRFCALYRALGLSTVRKTLPQR